MAEAAKVIDSFDLTPEMLATLTGGGGEPAPEVEDDEATRRRKFIEMISGPAKAVAAKLGVDPRAIVAQAALETGWGRSLPGGTSNNFFGIKAGDSWPGKRVDAATTEYENGVAVGQGAKFRAYDSPEESVNDYAELIGGNRRYAPALNAGEDVRKYAEALQAGGYATDPEYANKIVGIADQVNLAPQPVTVVAELPYTLGPALAGPERRFARPAPPPTSLGPPFPGPTSRVSRPSLHTVPQAAQDRAAAMAGPMGGVMQASQTDPRVGPKEEFSVNPLGSLWESVTESSKPASWSDMGSAFWNTVKIMAQGSKLENLEEVEQAMRAGAMYRGTTPTDDLMGALRGEAPNVPTEAMLMADPDFVELLQAIKESRAANHESFMKIKGAYDRNPSFWSRVMLNIAQGTPAAAGVLGTLAVTRNPIAAAGVSYATTEPVAYAGLREAEVPVQQAREHATVEGMINAMSQRIPMGAALRAGSPLQQKLVQTIGAAIPASTAASIASEINHYAATLPGDMTVGDWREAVERGVIRLPETWATAIAQGGLMAGVGHATQKQPAAAPKYKPGDSYRTSTEEMMRAGADEQARRAYEAEYAAGKAKGPTASGAPAKMLPPPVSGSPSPDQQSRAASAPVRDNGQGMASILTQQPKPASPPPRPDAPIWMEGAIRGARQLYPTTAKTAPPGPTAPTVSTPAPQPQAESVSTTAQTQPGGAVAALPPDTNAPPKAGPMPTPPAPQVKKPAIVPVDDIENFYSEEHGWKALQEGNYTTAQTKGGPTLLVQYHAKGDGRIDAFKPDGEPIGSMSYPLNDSARMKQPHVSLSKEHRRRGIATAMYGLARKSGAQLPGAHALGQNRTPEGQAFREAEEKRVATPPAAKTELSADDIALSRRIGLSHQWLKAAERDLAKRGKQALKPERRKELEEQARGEREKVKQLEAQYTAQTGRVYGQTTATPPATTAATTAAPAVTTTPATTTAAPAAKAKKGKIDLPPPPSTKGEKLTEGQAYVVKENIKDINEQWDDYQSLLARYGGKLPEDKYPRSDLTPHLAAMRDAKTHKEWRDALGAVRNAVTVARNRAPDVFRKELLSGPLKIPPPPKAKKADAYYVQKVADARPKVEALWPAYQQIREQLEKENSWFADKKAREIEDAFDRLDSKKWPVYGTAMENLADELREAIERVKPPRKQLEPEKTYPTGKDLGPVRENVGAEGKSDPSDVTELPTTHDKFEEIINEFPALFEAPEKRVALPLVRHWKKRGTPFISPEEAAKRIESWQDHADAQRKIAYPNGNSEKVILSLFDLTGHWAAPYVDAGYTVHTFDIQSGQDVRDFSVEWFADHYPEIHTVYGILIAVPCTDFTVSGNQHWPAKDVNGSTELSKELVFKALQTVEFFRPAMWVLENPVGRIEALTGLPPARMAFDPWHFGDPYTKRTVLWGKFNANLPTAPVDPVEGSKMWSQYGGKSQATKNARSATPQGFASAFFMANNYLDATPAERLLSQFPLAAGAIEKALEAGFSEAQIREVVTYPYEDYEEDEARDAVKQLVKTGTPEGEQTKLPKAAKQTKAKQGKKAADEPEPVVDEDEDAVVGLDDDIGTRAANDDEPGSTKGTRKVATSDAPRGDLTEEQLAQFEASKSKPEPKDIAEEPKPGTPADDPMRAIAAGKAAEGRAQIAAEEAKNPPSMPKRDTTPGRSTYDTIWYDLAPQALPGESVEAYARRTEAWVERMRNTNVDQQIKIIKQRTERIFGFRSIVLDPNLAKREAIDAMLDAYNNMSTHSGLTSMPAEAMGFNGGLSLKLNHRIDKQGTRGQFTMKWGAPFEETATITLARRSDSWVHEHMHALDYNMLTRYFLTHTGGLSEKTAMGVGTLKQDKKQLEAKEVEPLPEPVRDAFLNLMRSIYLTNDTAIQQIGKMSIELEDAKAALAKAKDKLNYWLKSAGTDVDRAKKIADLEKKAAAQKNKKKAESMRNSAANIRAYMVKSAAEIKKARAVVDTAQAKVEGIVKGIKSLFNKNVSDLYQGSAFVDQLSGDPYYSLATELMARAGESYIGNLIGQQGGAEFLAGRPNYYNENSNRVMQIVYPNPADRVRINQALSDFFSALATTQYFTGTVHATRIPGDTRIDKALWEADQNQPTVGFMRRAFEGTVADINALAKVFRTMTDARSATEALMIAGETGMTALNAAAEVSRFYYSGRGRVFALRTKYKKTPELHAKIKRIGAMITTDPGSGDVQGVTMEREIAQQSQALINRAARITEVHGLNMDDPEQMAQLNEELVRPHEKVRFELKESLADVRFQLQFIEGDRNKEVQVARVKQQIGIIEGFLAKYEHQSAAPANIRKAADAIHRLYDERWYAADAVGIKLGYVSNYQQRSLNRDAIEANPKKFLERAQAVYEFEQLRGLRRLQKAIDEIESEITKWHAVEKRSGNKLPRVKVLEARIAELRAQAREIAELNPENQAKEYLYAARTGEMFTFDAATPPSKFVRERKFGPIADILLGEFHEQNPIESLFTYIVNSVRRVAYARRFGDDHLKRRVMMDELRSLGMKEIDIDEFNQTINSLAGYHSAMVSHNQRMALDVLYNSATMALLPMNLFSQLAEPLAASLRTGDVRDSFINLGYTIQALTNTGDMADIRAIADAIGIISRSGHDMIAMSRLDGADLSKLSKRWMSAYQRRTGVHGYTNASRMATLKLGGMYVKSVADLFFSKDPKKVQTAIELLRELGIENVDHERFAKYARGRGNLISLDDLSRPEDHDLKTQYIHALHGFVDGIIGNPKASDKTLMSSHPLGRFLVSLTAFNRYFQRHHLVRFGKQFGRSAKRIGDAAKGLGGPNKAGAAKDTAGAAAGTAGMSLKWLLCLLPLLVGSYAQRLLREAAADRERLKRRLEQATPTRVVTDAADLSGVTGDFSKLYNYFWPNRYESRSILETLGGSHVTFYSDAIDDIRDAGADKKDPNDTSNFAERKAARAMYRLSVNTLLPALLTSMGLNNTIGFLAQSGLMARSTADDFAEWKAPKTVSEKYGDMKKAVKKEEESMLTAKEREILNLEKAERRADREERMQDELDEYEFDHQE